MAIARVCAEKGTSKMLTTVPSRWIASRKRCLRKVVTGKKTWQKSKRMIFVRTGHEVALDARMVLQPHGAIIIGVFEFRTSYLGFLGFLNRGRRRCFYGLCFLHFLSRSGNLHSHGDWFLLFLRHTSWLQVRNTLKFSLTAKIIMF